MTVSGHGNFLRDVNHFIFTTSSTPPSLKGRSRFFKVKNCERVQFINFLMVFFCDFYIVLF